ncbi:alpha/beta-hydrolase [Gymnopus androsaceus JB14]|uniref:Alpha/beta-hydrolase n=1 Tax=Gymnopus androsaceus JB14 TaxID=1447944 RepID=A0A6A4HKJ0_9AGAR|nr:alpha/beta-hydrolase [Gymnopus androsaceus JB14]
MSTDFSLLQLPGGVNIAYEVLGASFLGRRRPIVLISGLSIVRKDWALLSHTLSQSRPVLVYDHRGIGDSVCSPSAVEEISIENMALDLFSLLIHLQWKEFAICGWSMGGVVAQQLLVLPFHPRYPLALPFRVTHVFLAGTRSVVLQANKHGFQKRVLSNTFDPMWLQQNQGRFETLFRGWLSGVRPAAVIGIVDFSFLSPYSLPIYLLQKFPAKQQQAVASFNIQYLLPYIPRDIKVLVIHGELDQIIPFSAGREIPSFIPSARFMPIGPSAGQVWSTTFGHFWFQYFDIDMWREVLESHMSS